MHQKKKQMVVMKNSDLSHGIESVKKNIQKTTTSSQGLYVFVSKVSLNHFVI